jgi:ADP-heptose:LPS heptosyltransferase
MPRARNWSFWLESICKDLRKSGDTSEANASCAELLDCCLGGRLWTPALLDRAILADEGRTLLSVVVERLGDLFEPRLCETYDRLFTETIARVAPDLMPRVRPAPAAALPPENPGNIYVLSRVTLGADIAVTSVLMDAVKQRYPNAQIHFVGSRKSFELFEADERIRHFPAPYARSGSLAERLRASASLWFDHGMVLDPDSRLTQLGLIRVCNDRNYFFFPSRSFGGGSDDRLPDLAARWAHDVFAVKNVKPYIAPLAVNGSPADIAVSLGVGENGAKRIGDTFERDLLQALSDTGASVLVDKGGSEEESARVERALPPGMRTHDGAFAAFAAQIARSKLFVGYDSAGGHVASACGVPLISIAKGFVSARSAARWRPKGVIIDGGSTNALEAVKAALQQFEPS